MSVASASAPAFFLFGGASIAIIMSNAGAAYGSAKASIGVANVAFVQPNKLLRAIIPVIMAGILGIYGLIIAIVINGAAPTVLTTAKAGYAGFAAGIIVGFSALASGLAIGLAGDALVRAYAQTEKVFVVMVLVMIFSEAIGLFGFIIAILVAADIK